MNEKDKTSNAEPVSEDKSMLIESMTKLIE